MTTAAPASVSRRAMPAPIPRAAPVTTATRPSRSSSSATGGARHGRSPSAGRMTRRSVTIAVTRSAGVTSKARFNARDPAGAVRRPPNASTSSSSRSSISISSPDGRRRIERRLRRGDDERDHRRGRRRAPADRCRSCWRRRRWRRCGRRRRSRRRPGPGRSRSARRRRRRRGARCRAASSSNAVRREPCSSGRVSSAVTDVSRPRSCSSRTMPSAVPHSTVARPPVLQCVCTRTGESTELLEQIGATDRQPSVRRARPPPPSPPPRRRRAAAPRPSWDSTRSTAHARLTAVGRAAAIRAASARTTSSPRRRARPAGPPVRRRTPRPRRSPGPRGRPAGGWRRSWRRRRAPRARTTSSGRRVWSMRTAWSPRHSIVRIASGS